MFSIYKSNNVCFNYLQKSFNYSYLFFWIIVESIIKKVAKKRITQHIEVKAEKERKRGSNKVLKGLKKEKENWLAKKKKKTNTSDYWYLSIPFYIFIVLEKTARKIFKWISQIIIEEEKEKKNHLNGLIMILLNHRL